MSEIYIEGRFKMPVVNTDEFGYDGDEVKKFDWEEFAKDEFWNSCEDMGELEDKYDITFQRVQPQLTIPKSIAEQADKYLRMDWEFWDIYCETGKCSHEFYNFINCEDNNQENSKLIIAYLAGQALGVDLVKVVADENI